MSNAKVSKALERSINKFPGVLPFSICRLCETCHVVEDEFHVVMECTLYDDIRKDCLSNISGFIPFFMLTMEEQFIQVMSNPKIYRSVSKAMYLVLNRRHNVMTK